MRLALDGATSDPRIRRSWWVFSGTLSMLGALLLARIAAGGPEPFDWVAVTLVVGVAIAAVRHRDSVRALETDRRVEAESFARILAGLSRSVSEDAIIGAIVAELADATGADHIVVALVRPDDRALQTTLISARAGVPPSSTLLPLPDLGDPGRPAPAGRPSATDRIADQVRLAYGLSNPLVAPFRGRDGVSGAILLSRRGSGGWPETAQRLLDGAVREASAALSRAGSHRTAELQASTDALTGLPNRRYFDEFCGLLAGRRRAGDLVGILMIDVDRFKVLNDTYGHSTGDLVLKAVGGAIMDAVRDDDVPARYGGEEFVVLLRDPSPPLALDIGERVRSAVAALELSDLGVARVSVSVGVAVATHPDQPIGDIIASADAAMYRAKQAGRDRVMAA
jgi:eukaryotic-like serine/threonine-protein kinase